LLPPLDRSFYQKSAVQVAPTLLGKTLQVNLDGNPVAGIIIEAEAYQGEGDLACHAKSGKTNRTRVMYGPAGHAYVYFTYGQHWMFNIVTDQKEEPAAVLIRAIRPTLGLDLIAQRRHPRPASIWCDGPAKLCQALGINGSHNGLDLCQPDGLIQITEGIQVPQANIRQCPRIGLGSTPEPWLSIPWRFYLPTIYPLPESPNQPTKL
jgi:DNA-3-methyladenine glycosylase